MSRNIFNDENYYPCPGFYEKDDKDLDQLNMINF